MFTIITSNHYSQKKLYLKNMKLDYVTCGDVKYCIVRIKKAENVSWNVIENLLGATKERVIVTNEITLPSTTAIKQLDIINYSHVTTMNALQEILSYNQKYIKNKTVTLIDINCHYQNYANILVGFFGVVRIITKKMQLYEDYKNTMYYECGANILVSNKIFPSASDNVLFVSPDGIILSNMINQTIPIIIPKKLGFDAHSYIYHSFRAETPNEYLEAIPHDLLKLDSIQIDSEEKENPQMFLHSYQAAIYQYCGIKALGSLKPIYCYKNNNKIMMDTIKNNIFAIDIN
ncbi:hypothetical protein RBG61_02510 [Paludicola sp. MB14-C6]|uniref:hypothetical protein n=1 Tax=Paludihabitans sp. MB14-C6 TaxID=3070656 RepID=UPI0027DB74E6|nr:hypothetical protein [Paludicola sp. MB14-C6]WMJ23565.1 hypothetical protein RBG61_02510 [Paludicola sp. MB14-C6]